MEQQSNLIKKMKTLILGLGTVAMLTTLQSCGKGYDTAEEAKKEAIEKIDKELQNKQDDLKDTEEKEVKLREEINKLEQDKTIRETK